MATSSVVAAAFRVGLVEGGRLEIRAQLQPGPHLSLDQHADEAGYLGVRVSGGDLVDRGVHRVGRSSRYGGVAQQVLAHLGQLRRHGLLLGIVHSAKCAG